MASPFIILGGGLSGLAAAIRLARFGLPTLILEKHTRPGGLNSYYYRKGMLFESGLHAMTNFARPDDRRAPLNRLFRQLKLSRKAWLTHEQIGSEIHFPTATLRFSNELALLAEEIAVHFPRSVDNFLQLVSIVREYDPFEPRPFLSTRQRLETLFADKLLVEMLLCPIMIYGNSMEHDMDFGQFVIMFHAVFLEGFFRPHGSIKDFLDMLVAHYLALGGAIRYQAEVESLVHGSDAVQAVRLKDGEEIACQAVLSTIGAHGTMRLLPESLAGRQDDFCGRMSFMESIYVLPRKAVAPLKNDCTCIFYSSTDALQYCRPDQAVSVDTAVFNFPANFVGMPEEELVQIRVTHPANYDIWKMADSGKEQGERRSSAYEALKKEWQAGSLAAMTKTIGNFEQNIVYQDTFTPLTIEHYSGKAAGAVYGSPLKVKDGRTRYRNLFLAGTDQGFLGIVGAMLSGVTIVNQQLLLD